MAQKEVDKYTKRLTLLAKGKLTEAAAVTTGGGKAAEAAKSFTEADEGENIDGKALKGKSMGKGKGSGQTPPLDGELSMCSAAESLHLCCTELHAKPQRSDQDS